MNSTARSHLADNPVAVIGLDGLFPRSANLHEFWDNIVEARDCIDEVPETHWNIDDHYDPDPSASDKTYCKRGGFLPTVDFDPMEFGLPPKALEVTDILQVLSLLVGKRTLADAGTADADWYDPSRTGVVLGVTGANSLTQPLATRLQTPILKEAVRSCGLTDRDADEIADRFTRAFAPWEENSFPGMLGNVVAGRIANRFDLGGKNCTIDAACASSLAAVDTAVSELVSGRADLMLTGGCDAENTILMYLCFSKTPAFSQEGRIRPFDESADGTLIGEGIGMLALKRLDDAERDGDRIYSVLRGMGSSSDGRFNSIYAPRKEGQMLALRRAYDDAHCGPEEVGLLECHGTGTPVGDHTELSALREVYEPCSEQRQYAALGSVKSQFGHTKAAAGAASLIKLSLSLDQKVLPPTINVDEPRSDVDFAESPFYVNTEARPWVHDPHRPVRRAAVSSFGFGGTNFHCVLEEPRATAESRSLHAGDRVSLWHAADPAELAALLRSGAEGSDPDSPVPDDNARLAVVAADDGERDRLCTSAAERIEQDPQAVSFELPGGAYYRRSALLGRRDAPRVAALFAGQGSQYVGMGMRSAITVPPVRAAFDEAVRHTDLGRVVFPPPAFDHATEHAQQELLRRTENAQPGIGALASGQFQYLAELGFSPDGALGHSFGEVTALWAAGSLSTEDLHRVAAARGSAMSVDDGDAGTMAAINTSPESVAELLAGHGDVAVCNLNAPDQTVVGGGTRAVEEFVRTCREAGVGANQLPVAGAFHTAYVAHAVAPFASAMADVDISEPWFPVYPNTEGAKYGVDVDGNRQVLVDQITSALSFAPRVREMYDDGFRVFVEFGPRSVLCGLVRRILGDCSDVHVLSADPSATGDSDRSLKRLAAQLAVLGQPLTRLNRYAADIVADESNKAMTIPLNGVNYVSDERRQAYREALNNGYRVEGGTAEPHADHRHDTAPASSPEPTAGAEPCGGAPVNDHVERQQHGGAPVPGETERDRLAAEHLAVHREYLDGQLSVAQQLTAMLRHESEVGPRQGMISGIAAVTEHGVAVGRSHQHASEVLRGFAEADGVNVTQASAFRLQPPALQPGPAEPAVSPDRVQYGAAPESSAERPDSSASQQAPSAPRQAPQQPAQPPQPAPERIGMSAQPQPEYTQVPQSAVHGQVDLVPVPAAEQVAQEAHAPGNDREHVQQTLLDIVAEKTGYPANMLDPGMDVEADLGLDSIKRVEIMGLLRERFSSAAETDPEQLGELRTLRDIVDLITTAASSAGRGESAPKA